MRLPILYHILLVKGLAQDTTSYYMSILHQIVMYSYHHNRDIHFTHIVETPNNITRLDNIGWLKREKIATWAI
jgi:hypothetical protein